MNIPASRLATLMAQDVPGLNVGAKLLAYRYHEVREGSSLFQEIQWARDVYAAVVEKLCQWEEPYRSMSLNYLKNTISYYERDKQPDDKIIPSEEEQEKEQAL